MGVNLKVMKFYFRASFFQFEKLEVHIRGEFLSEFLKGA